MNKLKTLLPVLAAAASFLTAWLWPDSTAHPAAAHPYFSILLAGVLVLAAAGFLAGLALPAFGANYAQNAPFYAGILMFLCILNILTAKTATLPVLYFPSLDRVFGVLVEDAAFIGKCLLYSLRLQLVGWLCGAAAGTLTGSTAMCVTGCSRSCACLAQSHPPHGFRSCSSAFQR